MGNEDSGYKAVADKKCYTAMAITAAVCIAAYFVLGFGIDTEDQRISEIKRGNDEKTYQLEAEFKYGEESLVVNPELIVREVNSKATEVNGNEITDKRESTAEWLSDFADKLVYELNKNTDGESLMLPASKDGVSIRWVLPGKEKPTWIFGLAVLICTFMYFSRYDSLKKDDKEKRQEFDNEITNMISRFILLLNAGLVTDSAFENLIKDTSANMNPLYVKFRELYEKSINENLPLTNLLYSFSINYPNRDFMRFASIVYENSGRGSRLAEKLENEALSSYESRMSFAKAKVKQAETKLCFPLVLLLLALVIICIAPAMIGM